MNQATVKWRVRVRLIMWLCNVHAQTKSFKLLQDSELQDCNKYKDVDWLHEMYIGLQTQDSNEFIFKFEGQTKIGIKIRMQQ